MFHALILVHGCTGLRSCLVWLAGMRLFLFYRRFLLVRLVLWHPLLLVGRLTQRHKRQRHCCNKYRNYLHNVLLHTLLIRIGRSLWTLSSLCYPLLFFRGVGLDFQIWSLRRRGYPAGCSSLSHRIGLRQPTLQPIFIEHHAAVSTTPNSVGARSLIVAVVDGLITRRTVSQMRLRGVAAMPTFGRLIATTAWTEETFRGG